MVPYYTRAALTDGMQQLYSNESSHPLTIDSFPKQLIQAVSKTAFSKIREVELQDSITRGEKVKIALLEAMREKGESCLIGKDLFNRSFFTAAVIHSGSEKTGVITIYQQSFDKAQFCYNATQFLPTNDERLSDPSRKIEDRYAAIQEIYENRHCDLSLPDSEELQRRRQFQLLKDCGIISLEEKKTLS